ncbi:anaerobic ribonucleoside-triphosphate reductase activating protein [Burkholderia plantarii]|uniref:anaerobic ribonucleoside-triphosphate reductase activating protein n=1 Tax=Burkholderia plantarii TaxID=41899 RepID=UPI000705751C|nr:radical SAM domain protein [Burkholderia plantarii]
MTMIIELAHAPKLGGVVPFSTCDYPGRLACVVFVSGCPWRCHYCHNPHLQTRACHAGPQAWDDTLAWLARRTGLLDAVVFCGGEPLVERHLPAMIAQVRRMGFAAALHTGGAYPDRLAQCLPMLEWVGFDVKAPFTAYPRITQVARSGAAADRSLGLIAGSGVAFECRITIHPALLDDADLLAVAQTLAQRGITKLVLQPFRGTGCTSAPLLDAPLPAGYPGPALLDRMRAVLPAVEVRRHA